MEACLIILVVLGVPGAIVVGYHLRLERRFAAILQQLEELRTELRMAGQENQRLRELVQSVELSPPETIPQSSPAHTAEPHATASDNAIDAAPLAKVPAPHTAAGESGADGAEAGPSQDPSSATDPAPESPDLPPLPTESSPPTSPPTRVLDVSRPAAAARDLGADMERQADPDLQGDADSRQREVQHAQAAGEAEGPGDERAVASDEQPESPAGAPQADALTLPPPKPGVDWERWLGVRGAAVAGAVALALAGILFLKYSIEAGLIPPMLRVAFAYLAGVGAVAGAGLLRRRGYGPASEAVSGAGVVILYGATWSARVLYGLIGYPLAFLLMVLVTVTGGLISLRYRSLVTATLGLIGGFATPLLLSQGGDRPIGLFGYLLLLNLGIWWLSRRAGWPAGVQRALNLLAQALTLGYQGLWIFGRMGPDRGLLGLGILSAFVLFYGLTAVRDARRGSDGEAAGATKGDSEKTVRWRLVLGLLSPFAFGVYYASQVVPLVSPLALGAWLAMLTVFALWVARRMQQPILALGAVAADLGILLIGAGSFLEPTQGGSWTYTLVALGLALITHLALELWGRGDDRRDSFGLCATVAVLGFQLLIMLQLWGSHTLHFWPWFVVTSLLVALAVRQTQIGPKTYTALISVSLLALGLWTLGHGLDRVAGGATRASSGQITLPPDLPSALPFFVIVLLGALLLRAYAEFLVAAPGPSWRRSQSRETAGSQESTGSQDTTESQGKAYSLENTAAQESASAELDLDPGFAGQWTATALPLVFVVLALPHRGLGGPAFYLFALALTLLALLGATRLRSARLFALISAMSAYQHFLRGPGFDVEDSRVVALLGPVAGLLLITAWPYLTRTFWRERARVHGGDETENEPQPVVQKQGLRWPGVGLVWIVSALAGPAWFPVLHRAYTRLFGDGTIGILPLALAALSVLSLRWSLRDGELRRGSSAWRSRVAWLGAIALGFVSIAVPLQLDREWITVAWALEGLAVLMLWQRVRHPGLQIFSIVLHALVLVRLLLNPEVLGYHPASGLPVFNWLTYTYLLPAVALLASARVLMQHRPAAPPSEVELSANGGYRELWVPAARHAMGCGLGAVILGFAWINLTVIDFFAPGRDLSLELDRLPARDLSLSISWIAYALLLLGVGMARRTISLRWLSLGFLILAILKVFLYDLGELEDLYRVASLVGLAFSLILVSLLYQRFVFRNRAEDEAQSSDLETET